MRKRVWQILLLHCIMQADVRAQTCVGDYFAIEYTTVTAQKATRATITPQNDILLAGSVLKPGSLETEGWLTKLSPQGIVLWSRKYAASELQFNSLHINKAIPDGDNAYMIIGSICRVVPNQTPATVIRQSGLLMRIDRDGEVISAQWYTNYVSGQLSEFNDIVATRDGGFILALNYWGDTDMKSRNKLVKIPGRTPIDWGCSFNWPNEPAKLGPMQIQYLPGDRLILANAIRIFDFNSPWLVTRQGYFVACINTVSGMPDWERMYTYAGDPANSTAVFGDVSHITGLPNGDLSFIASYADTKHNSFRETKKLVNLITDNTGNLKNVKAYYGPQSIYATAGAPGKSQGEQVLLLDNGESPYLLELNASGDIQWQKSYPLIGPGQQTRSMLSTVNGYYFFSYAHNGDGTKLKLVKTDAAGNADCVEEAVSFITEDASADFRTETIDPNYDFTEGVWARLNSVVSGRYSSIAGQVICRNEDIARVPIPVCDADSYTLPTNEVITASGTYTATYTTAGGCDSMVHYIATFSKNPLAQLGEDDCLDGKDSVILKTAGGYSGYNWMGSNRSDSFLVVKAPGTYFVSVSNVCGTSTDSAEVYDKCEFDIYVPNAFTPNGDNNNDYFGLPKLNKNRFINLKVYNRWGQIIFQTSKKGERWDGNCKGQKAPSGTYVYLLTVETLNGKRRQQKGLVTLIR